MRVHRLIAILLLVESNRSIKASELASRLEVSTRTIYRDIDQLCEAGIPLRTATGPKGGVELIGGFSTGFENLHEEDFKQLYLSIIGIKPLKESEFSHRTNNTFLKLLKNIPIEYTSHFESLNNKFYFDENPWWGSTKKLNHIDSLLTSIFQSTILVISYKKTNETFSVRRVRPYGVVVKQSDWYLVAYCENSQAIRTFKCDRIIETTRVQEQFSIPVHFSIGAYWQESKQNFLSNCSVNEYYPVQIKINNKDLHLFSKFESIEIVEEDKLLSLTINLYDFHYATKTLLQHLPLIEVLKPFEVREWIVHTLNDLSLKYNLSSIQP